MFLLFQRKTRGWTTFVLLSFGVLFFAIPVHAAQRAPKCCVWRVTNAKAPFYLLGSIHALGRKDYPLPAPYATALKGAQRLVDTRSYSNVSTSHGLDNYLLERAKRMGKEIGGLESVDEHVAVVGGLSDRDGEILLRDALARAKTGRADFERMRKAWRKG